MIFFLYDVTELYEDAATPLNFCYRSSRKTQRPMFIKTDYWIAISGTLLTWMIYLLCFFVYLLFFKNLPRLKIEVHNIQSWMSKWIFEVVKSCARKMVKRTHFLLNPKMVKSFLGRSNSIFRLNQLTSIVDIPCRIIIGNFSC